MSETVLALTHALSMPHARRNLDDFLETALAGGTAYTLGVSPDAAVTLTSATPAATVTPRAVTTVPTAVDPRTITFDVSTTSVVPPKPADVRLINADV